jgi:ABC-type uncharacterized transport system auxiliary subunit
VPRQVGGAVHVDAAASIFDHDDIEAFAPRVFARVAHAKIEGEASYKNSFETAFTQVSHESGRRFAIVFVER